MSKDWIQEIRNFDKNLIGEIVSSSSVGFEIRAYELDKSPEYATLVCSISGDTLVFGMINYVNMSPEISPSGSFPKPLRRTREELATHYKDIKDKLIITAKAASIGFYKNGKFYQERPRKIPWIHDLVYIPTKELIRNFHYIEGKITLKYVPLAYTAFPENEKGIFHIYLKTYLEYLSESFDENEIFELLGSIQESLVHTEFENLIGSDTITRIFEEIFYKKNII